MPTENSNRWYRQKQNAQPRQENFERVDRPLARHPANRHAVSIRQTDDADDADGSGSADCDSGAADSGNVPDRPFTAESRSPESAGHRMDSLRRADAGAAMAG